MSLYFCPGTGDFGLVLPLKEKKIIQQQQKKKKKKVAGSSGWRWPQRSTAWWSFLHVLDCPKQRLSLDKCFHPFSWTCLLVCAKAIPQVNSMRFWNIFLLLLHWSKRSLCEASELWTPSQRGQPWDTQNANESRAQQGRCGGCISTSQMGRDGEAGVGDVFLLHKWAERLMGQAWAISLPRDVGGEDPVLQECTVCVCLQAGQRRWSHKRVIQLSAAPELQAGVNSCMLCVQSCGYHQQGAVCTPWDWLLLRSISVAPQKILWEVQLHHFQLPKSKLHKSKASHCLKKGSRLRGRRTPAGSDVWC